MAVQLTIADMYPLAAGLFGNIGLVIDKTVEDFPELRQSDRIYIIMTEWRKRQVKCPSAEQIVPVFEKVKLNKHIICLVCIVKKWPGTLIHEYKRDYYWDEINLVSVIG